jgi:hypothetical protein
MPGMMMAARAGNRMQTRQAYRTIGRMNRRRGNDGYGGYGHQQPQYYEPPPPRAAAAPPYLAELERLGQLYAQGVLSDVEFATKKRQILGI